MFLRIILPTQYNQQERSSYETIIPPRLFYTLQPQSNQKTTNFPPAALFACYIHQTKFNILAVSIKASSLVFNKHSDVMAALGLIYIRKRNRQKCTLSNKLMVLHSYRCWADYAIQIQIIYREYRAPFCLDNNTLVANSVKIDAEICVNFKVIAPSSIHSRRGKILVLVKIDR